MYSYNLLFLWESAVGHVKKKRKETEKKIIMCEGACHKMGLVVHCCSEWLKVRECWALEQSDDRQASRLRGRKSDGRHRKTGRQVNISDGDGPQRTLRLLHRSLSANKVLTVHFCTHSKTLITNARGPGETSV